ncbi:exodeoxyribonuclease V subunit gamma [Tolumonas lignilytica]|uniref:exodeoxyribonuclease V subunit gamma n=1 Tax=Tolumonas lignilytica TaxID=1283284 RepID=UPI0009E09019|nr:exodeoxyribonuclease V subunit gamma [Tolumonas lignilytica]
MLPLENGGLSGFFPEADSGGRGLSSIIDGLARRRITAMFRVYHSNQLDVLKSLLAHLINRSPLQPVLAAETILVQSPGMAQWLKQALAQEMGIAANITFPLPSSFIWQMFHQVLPEVPQENPYTKPAMLWRLMQLLPQCMDDVLFSALAGYLAEDQDGRRCYQLCQRIADLFDQYLVYRPDWIVDWEGGGAAGAEAQPWQPVLWRRLVAMTEQQASHLHRVNLFSQFIHTLQRGKPAAVLPQRLFVFGISSLPPHYLEALVALGEHCEVHLLLTNPCRYYWGDLQEENQINQRMLNKLLVQRREQWQQQALTSPLLPEQDWSQLFNEEGEQQGNPLLVSLGKQGRDYLALLAEISAAEIDAFADVGTDSLLHLLQQDLLDLQDGTRLRPKRLIQPQDRSLVLHGCHSPLREVEVLHDQLLQRFAADPTLTPKEIVVMVADINRYGPYIQAVFGSAAGERVIPYSISDRAATQENPLLQSFLTLLSLPDLRCTAAELLELLAVPALLQQFGLVESDLTTLRQWVVESGIRWGLAPEDGSHFQVPPRERHTWSFGLERMLLGFASGNETLFADIAPYTAIEGQNAVKLGQMARFITQVIALRTELQTTRPITEWQNLVDRILLTFYLPQEQLEEADADALSLIRATLQRWQQRLTAMDYQQPLSLTVFHDHMQSELTAVRGGQQFLAGRVNFCTLMPMRAIPFRLVCLLGMNDGVYPRSMPPLGFDLMADQPRKGDRSRREDDRYLFLEALLAAQQQLYISYVAHSAIDNREQMPSVLVSELLEYCQRSFLLPEDQAKPETEQETALSQHLLIEHPLVAYDQRYFAPQAQLSDARWFSYAAEWLPALTPGEQAPFFDGRLALPAELAAHPEIELSDWLRFFRNPVAGFFHRRLRVQFAARETALEEVEPFWPDKLQQYQLRERLLRYQRREVASDVWQSRLLAEGALPDGEFGRLALTQDANNLQPLVDAFRAWPLAAAQRETFHLDFSGWQLLGSVGELYDGQLVRHRVSQLKANWLIAIWLEHLALCAANKLHKPTHLLVLDNGKLSEWSLALLNVADARQQLQRWYQAFIDGLQQPLCLPVNTAWHWLEKAMTEQGELGDAAQQLLAREAALKTYLGDGQFILGEVEDSYLARTFPELDAVHWDVLCHWAEHLLLPLRQHLQEAAV